MTQEEKELLLKDLCARLPYGVKCTCFQNKSCSPYLIDFRDNTIHSTSDFNGTYIKINIEDCRLYLRPMSSMTEKERKEVEILIKENRPSPYGVINNKGIDNLLFSVSVTSGVLTDWLNSHHFNYRGLIEKGLALEAPEGMYEY